MWDRESEKEKNGQNGEGYRFDGTKRLFISFSSLYTFIHILHNIR